MTTTRIRTYSELIRIPTFEERLEYLRLYNLVGRDTFGYDRYLNQRFYTDYAWQKVRRDVIVRDSACDLAFPGNEISGKIIVHHMNPLTKEDILQHSESIIDPEFLICTSDATHRAIHYGAAMPKGLTVRSINDTCPWRNEDD